MKGSDRGLGRKQDKRQNEGKREDRERKNARKNDFIFGQRARGERKLKLEKRNMV